MKNYRVSVVGGESLLGKEIRETLRVSSYPLEVSLIGGDEEETGRITEQAGEPVIITAMEQTGLVTSDFVVLAGTELSSRKAWEMTGPGPGPFVIDATRVLEDVPSARVGGLPPHSPAIIAHPAAEVLSDFFRLIGGKLPVTRSVVNVFEPASERGQAGIDQLHKQTVNLFSFQPLPKDIFDDQIAYNMLPALGEAAAPTLEQIELQIERHFATLAAAHPTPLIPSIRLVQAPVFHAYSMSVWLELESESGFEQIAAALTSDRVDVRTREEPAATNVTIASEPGFAVGNIRQDRNHPRAWWLWIAADNLRITAEATVRLIEQAVKGAA
ncbi:MAG: Asd/ArgC dimerization domain-containing protein [Bryobacteraceae bacterium]|nr:Asd/ArgC dimerization domain-containing protein [Bryobacteraceae bacterium]